MSMRWFLRAPLIMVITVALLAPVWSGTLVGGDWPDDDPFGRVWERVDGPVANGIVDRSWMWGPVPLANDLQEPYSATTAGTRAVRYYDKGRMELTDPAGDPSSPWYVTNGLLVRDLVLGKRQVGVDAFEPRAPAAINVAGDPDDSRAPTYAALRPLLDLPARPDGSAIVERIGSDGVIRVDPDVAAQQVVSAYRLTVPGIEHQVASVFWTFMQSTGPISVEGVVSDGPIFESPFYATGYPLTEAYWSTVRVGGVDQLVLWQAFERRVLTWTPSNPPGWRVESGNVGQHYFRWLYGNDVQSSPTPTVTATPASPTPTISPNTAPNLVTVGPGAVDDWTRAIVRDRADRVWIAAANNNAAYQQAGAGELRIYRADQTGIPASFSVVASGTIAATAGGTMPFVDAAIDAQDRLHVVWLDRGATGQPVRYAVFDLAGLEWLAPPIDLDQTELSGFGGNAAQGGVSIALGTDGLPRVAYAAVGNQTQIRVRALGADGWSAASEPVAVAGAFVWHPALASAPSGMWVVAAYDATNSRILASIDSGRGWQPPTTVATGVLGPESIDQGPGLLIDLSGIPTLTYVDGASYVRVSSFRDGAWTNADVGGGYVTHAPGIGVLADGRLVVAGNDDASPPRGVNTIWGTGSGWGNWAQAVAVRSDGSEVFRWAGNFSTPGQAFVDLLFFDEDSNDDGVLDDQTLYYVALRPA